MRVTTLWVTMSLALGTGCSSQKDQLRLEGDARRLQVELVRMYMSKGAYVAAAPMLQNLVKRAPDDPEILTMYGIVLRETALYGPAEAHFKKVLLKNPKYGAAQSNLALVYDLQQRYLEAEAAHRKALELNPSDHSEWNNLGFSLYLAGKTDQAVAAYEKSLSLAPDFAVAHNNLGFAYAKLDDWEKARRCFLTVGGVSAEQINMALAQQMFEQKPALFVPSRKKAKR